METEDDNDEAREPKTPTAAADPDSIGCLETDDDEEEGDEEEEEERGIKEGKTERSAERKGCVADAAGCSATAVVVVVVAAACVPERAACSSRNEISS